MKLKVAYFPNLPRHSHYDITNESPDGPSNKYSVIKDLSEAMANRLVSCYNNCEGLNPELIPEALRVLERLCNLGNGDKPGNSIGNVIAQDILKKLRVDSINGN